MPGATLVTGTDTLELPAATVIDIGTVATAGFVELKVNVTPLAVAGDDRVKDRFRVVPTPVMLRLAGKRLAAVPTSTNWVSPVMLNADALMLAEPAAAPVSNGCLARAVWPCGMMMFSGEMVAVDGSLLLRLTKTPPDGAARASVTGKFTCWPGATTTPVGSIMSRPEVIVTVADALPAFEAVLVAVIVAEPAATPVTGTLTLVEAAVNVTF